MHHKICSDLELVTSVIEKRHVLRFETINHNVGVSGIDDDGGHPSYSLR